METVSNMASAASRAIWGESGNANAATTENETQGQEPRSGEQGDVKAGEPYDKGNEEQTTKTDAPSKDDYETKDHETTLTSNPKPNANDSMPGNTPATEPIRSEHDTDKTGVTSKHNPTSATSSDPPSSSNDTSDSGPNPSVGADPSSAQQDTTKQQGADKPHDSPDEGSDEHDRIKETKKEAEEAAKVDTSGPGPKTLEEKAREIGGDMSGGGKGGSGDDEEDGPQKESHGEGTGEKYVKSSGVKAEGGDFDAANPGAGKEADRLLESQGIHREAPPSSQEAGTSASTDTTTDSKDKSKSDKPSFTEKIKAKLHRNKE